MQLPRSSWLTQKCSRQSTRSHRFAAFHIIISFARNYSVSVMKRATNSGKIDECWDRFQSTWLPRLSESGSILLAIICVYPDRSNDWPITRLLSACFKLKCDCTIWKKVELFKEISPNIKTNSKTARTSRTFQKLYYRSIHACFVYC